MSYHEKYLKYKTKYLVSLNQFGGGTSYAFGNKVNYHSAVNVDTQIKKKIDDLKEEIKVKNFYIGMWKKAIQEHFDENYIISICRLTTECEQLTNFLTPLLELQEHIAHIKDVGTEEIGHSTLNKFIFHSYNHAGCTVKDYSDSNPEAKYQCNTCRDFQLNRLYNFAINGNYDSISTDNGDGVSNPFGILGLLGAFKNKDGVWNLRPDLDWKCSR